MNLTGCTFPIHFRQALEIVIPFETQSRCLTSTMAIKLNIDVGEIGRLATKLGRIDRQLRAKALGRGLAKTAKSGATAAKKEIAKEYNIKQAEVAKRMTVSVNTAQLEARIRTRSLKTNRIPAIAFSAVHLKKKGVTIKVKRSKGKTLLKHAFISTMPSGHKGVYQRADKATRRLSIKEVMGIEVPAMLQSRAVLPAVEKRVNEQLIKTVVSSLQFEIDRVLAGN